MSIRTQKLAIVLFSLMMFEPRALNAQWQQVSGVPTNYVNAIRVDKASGLWFVGGFSFGVLRSSNRGATWTPATTGLTQWGMYVYDLTFFQGVLFAGTRDGVFRSTTFGDSWERISNGIILPGGDQLLSAYAFGVLNNTLHVGTHGGAYATTNLGTSWAPVIVNNNTIYQVDAFLQLGDSLFAGGGDRFVTGPGLFRSSNGGVAWMLGQVNFFPVGVFCVMNHHTGLYVGTSHGTFRSTDVGVSWVRVSEGLGPDPYVMAMVPYGDSLIAGSLNGVYVSTNAGDLWTSISDDLPAAGRAVQSMVNIDDTLYAGMENGGLWRRPLPGSTTPVAEAGVTPDEFMLLQNYPNPFNPETHIHFVLPDRSFTTLRVFNILGEVVQTLVHETLSPGPHSLTFDGSELPAGVYFYRLTSGSGHGEQRKMLLVK